MSPRRTLTPGLFLLLLPLFLLMLLAPFGRSYSGLGPGCHLFLGSILGRVVIDAPVIIQYFMSILSKIMDPQSPTIFGTSLTAFNVTIRSDRRGTCRGTHTVYACVGYCESSAFPSRYSVLAASNFTHNITSASRCCTISKDTKVKVRLDCPRGRRHDNIEILTARACRCDMCRKSRY